MAAFREVYSAFGVDEGPSPPVMMVPQNGSNVVALEGGEGMKVRPERAIVTVEKLSKAQVAEYLVQAEKFSARARGARQFAADTPFYRVKGVKVGGLKGTLLNAVNPDDPKKVQASIRAIVLGEKVVKVAIRPVMVSDGKGGWVPHAKVAFDPDVLLEQMNSIWLPQSNVRIKLVSKEPYRIDEKELQAELDRNKVSRADFLDRVHINAFDALFRKNKVKDADFTIFMVKAILNRELASGPRDKGTQPVGATPAKSGFCLTADGMLEDQVRKAKKIATIPGATPAHELGHHLGVDNHIDDKTGLLLMVDGGPTAGFGKITVDQTTRIFNGKY